MKIALGLGCDRGTPADTIARAIDIAINSSGGVALLTSSMIATSKL